MTKPKMRICPKCGASNPASRRTCVSCYICLLKSKEFKEKEKAVRTGKWGQNCLKYRNGARVVASARLMVSKLAALGYHPILLIGKKKKKKKNAVTAETITYMCPEGDGPMKPFLETMSRAYEYILTETLRIQVEEAATSLSPQQYTTSSSHPSCVSHPPHPSSSPSQLSPSPSSPLHPPQHITSNPRPSSPTLLTNSPTSTSPRSFPPHLSHPSSSLTPSFSHPLIKSEEEACPLTSVTVPFSPRFYGASSTAPAQSNMNKSVPRKHSVSPQPLKSQPVETEGACCLLCVHQHHRLQKLFKAADVLLRSSNGHESERGHRGGKGQMATLHLMWENLGGHLGAGEQHHLFY
ncbi:uncharacterized protein LOC117810436 isoform X2 [Notolabrus celidotus]|uniref:uncharacterized protein LOC117810436 isoform X2 n=1 Tax=Notolabrus celidotus TaxID=1203425 RepID=UPI00148FD167|nr:uncharacterized protein LOC117810436 isoform X2 [Notolabrus celidotus]